MFTKHDPEHDFVFPTLSLPFCHMTKASASPVSGLGKLKAIQVLYHAREGALSLRGTKTQEVVKAVIGRRKTEY